MAGIKQHHLTLVLFFQIFLVATLAPAWAAKQQNSTIITDAAGRTVTIPTSVKRIIPLGGALRFVTYLQGLDLVVGVEALEKKPLDGGRLYGLAVAEKVKNLPVIGEGGPGGKLPDFEQLIAVHPDLIVAVGVDKAQVETIQDKTGIPAVLLGTGAMAALDLKAIKESLTLLGSIIGRSERAATLTASIGGLEADLARRTSALSTRPTAYVGAIGYRGKHGITSTESHYAPLTWVGGNNVTDAITQPGHAFIDQEKLLFWNPEFIFLDAGGMDMVKDDYAKNPAFYAALKAVGAGRVFVMPPYNSYHTNIETALADAFFLGKALYPEAFADIEPAKKAEAIFEFFLGVKAYAHLEKAGYGFGRAVFDNGTITIR
ncbi:MAG: iron ABC transporter substrate-binding protein [Anaerolineales bacterium]|jgi:iron complex transport system substrate-binding protein|nr:iron ABC transporter substrate-binding protein [Anaerolineales bacterium]